MFMKYMMIAILVLATSSCKFDPNEDNPFTGYHGDKPTGDVPLDCDATCPQTHYVREQVKQICDKVNACIEEVSPGSTDKCSKLLPYQTGLETYYTTLNTKNYSELNKLYIKNKLTVDTRKSEECLAAINTLTCASAEFNNAFNVNDPTNYSNIHTILTVNESCVNIYTLKQ